MSLAHAHRFSAEDYLAFEEQQTTKHEYFKGEIFAMVGARDAHVTAAGNLFALLWNTLKGTPYRAYIADMKLRVEAADAFFYPDVFVTCDARDKTSDLYKRYPVLIAEVMSESTARYDRNQKFAAYRMLETLKEYLLIDTDQRIVEVFRPDDNGIWQTHVYRNTDRLILDSLALDIPVQEIFG